MKKNPVFIQNSATIMDAAILMKLQGVGSLLIQQGKEVGGIITETDIMHKVVLEGLSPGKTTVKEVMSTPVLSVDAKQSVIAAEELMQGKHFRHLVVADQAIYPAKQMGRNRVCTL